MKYICLVLLFFFMSLTDASSAEVRVGVYMPSSNTVRALSTNASFGEPVDFAIEPLIVDPPSNAARAKQEIWIYCFIEGVGIISDCNINLDWKARESSAGHLHSHIGVRPKGKFSITEGRVDQTDFYFKTTYSASDVSEIVDVTINCSSSFLSCTTGTAKIGVGITDFVELPASASSGSGYSLTGDDVYHPFNHFGQRDFIFALLDSFSKYHAMTEEVEHVGRAVSANDISLELGGVFDVPAKGQPGFDWTPPHRYHRLGQSIDISVPQTAVAQRILRGLLAAYGIFPHPEPRVNPNHWHLHVGAHL